MRPLSLSQVTKTREAVAALEKAKEKAAHFRQEAETLAKQVSTCLRLRDLLIACEASVAGYNAEQLPLRVVHV